MILIIIRSFCGLNCNHGSLNSLKTGGALPGLCGVDHIPDNTTFTGQGDVPFLARGKPPRKNQ